MRSLDFSRAFILADCFLFFFQRIEEPIMRVVTQTNKDQSENRADSIIWVVGMLNDVALLMFQRYTIA